MDYPNLFHRYFKRFLAAIYSTNDYLSIFIYTTCLILADFYYYYTLSTSPSPFTNYNSIQYEQVKYKLR